ncbi:MAG: putative nitrogen fixation protein NifT [Magnetococcales bacterium]|nr:putative nitrogen fixation protein NifT [Magnetococcales bacterium]
MPLVMLRKDSEGRLICYVPKKDLEARVTALEHDGEELWGGRLTLEDGESWYLEPISPRPGLPFEARVKRI